MHTRARARSKSGSGARIPKSQTSSSTRSPEPMVLCMFSPKGRHLIRGWPGRMEGDRVVQLAAQTLQSYFTGGGKAREHAEFRLDEVDLRPPVLHPPAVRDFYAFETHVRRARAARGLEVSAQWYEQPVFYFSNP